MDSYIIYGIGIIYAIIAYFIKKLISDNEENMKKLEAHNEKIYEKHMVDLEIIRKDISNNKDRVILLESNHTHLTNNFNLLYDAVKDLTNEIKNLNLRLAQK